MNLHESIIKTNITEIYIHIFEGRSRLRHILIIDVSIISIVKTRENSSCSNAYPTYFISYYLFIDEQKTYLYI